MLPAVNWNLTSQTNDNDAPRPLPGQKSRGRHAHTGVEILSGVVLVSSAQTGRQGRALACCGAAVWVEPPRRVSRGEGVGGEQTRAV